jgi:hypothetical protein
VESEHNGVGGHEFRDYVTIANGISHDYAAEESIFDRLATIAIADSRNDSSGFAR